MNNNGSQKKICWKSAHRKWPNVSWKKRTHSQHKHRSCGISANILFFVSCHFQPIYDLAIVFSVGLMSHKRKGFSHIPYFIAWLFSYTFGFVFDLLNRPKDKVDKTQSKYRKKRSFKKYYCFVVKRKAFYCCRRNYLSIHSRGAD